MGLNTTPKKHNICDTTYDQLTSRSGKHLVILLFLMQLSTTYYGKKDETDERINLERLPHHPYRPLCDWNAYRRVSEWEMKQA